MCLVSIIVPNYNHAAYIEKRLDSIYSQTFQDYELIVLDDASTDNSHLLIENSIKGKPNITYIRNSKNSGSTFKQWRNGLERCKGKYIWIAESDDYCEETFLEKTVSLLEHDKTLNCAFVQSIWIDSENQEFARAAHENFQKEELYANQFVKMKMLEGNYLYNASAILFRRSSYVSQKSELNIILNNYRYCGDWLFWIYIIKDSYVGLVYEFINYFRRVNNGVSEIGLMNSGTIEENFRIIQEIIKIYDLRLTKQDYIKISNTIISLWKKINNKKRPSSYQLIIKCLSINPILSGIVVYKLIRNKWR